MNRRIVQTKNGALTNRLVAIQKRQKRGEKHQRARISHVSGPESITVLARTTTLRWT
jgi:hypothetical protein